MIYMKHPTLGNLHLQDSEQSEREAQGWVRWPRTAAQKAGLQVAVAASVIAPEQQPAAEPAQATKRGPGRPRKTDARP